MEERIPGFQILQRCSKWACTLSKSGHRKGKVKVLVPVQAGMIGPKPQEQPWGWEQRLDSRPADVCTLFFSWLLYLISGFCWGRLVSQSPRGRTG